MSASLKGSVTKELHRLCFVLAVTEDLISASLLSQSGFLLDHQRSSAKELCEKCELYNAILNGVAPF